MSDDFLSTLWSRHSSVWIKGRAFVYAERGIVEYFDHDDDGMIRSICDGLRPYSQCRPLDYVLPEEDVNRFKIEVSVFRRWEAR